LTDSFHGTVFSVLFGKQFISDKYDGQTHYCDISLFTFHVLYSQNFHIATIFF